MEYENYNFHEHPLSLCEFEGYKLPRCHFCHLPYFFDGYNCSFCKFQPGKCSACHGEPSGSFYYCKQCWPNSPLFHKTCLEFPEQIQIALRPHCSLRFVKEESISSSDKFFNFLSNKSFHCDFCNKSRRGHKFCCDLCNFQICTARCTDSKVIRFHQGRREQIQHFSHQHPLILLNQEELEAKQCQMCRKKIDDGQPYYCCGPCGFQIHKLCGELLQQVHYPSHPRHSLKLEENTFLARYRCGACCLYIRRGLRYRRDDCEFDLHLECTSMKPSIKYQGHQHLLILVEIMSYCRPCNTCGFDIYYTFFVRCVECCLDFHVQCGPAIASLPPIAVNENHSHHLSLIVPGTLESTDGSTVFSCDICKEDIDSSEHPSYGCLEHCCYAHVRCVITEIQLEERERYKHFSHHHPLILLPDGMNHDDIKCNVCDELIIRRHPTYGCKPCIHYIHESCFALPMIMHHESHSHYLTQLHSRRGGVCSGCGKPFNYLSYGCKLCGFSLDLECVSEHPSIKQNNEYNCHEEAEDLGGIGHFSHHHPLTLLDPMLDNMECKLCCKSIQDSCFGCALCMFYIHRSCAKLPQEVQHSFHPRHYLTLQENNTSFDRYSCHACSSDIDSSLCYRCDECEFDLHLECVSWKPDIKYQDHQHPVILVENMSYQSQCQTCHFEIENTFFLRCVECRFDFHVQCGPTSLPLTVVHQHHDDPLTLTSETLVKDGCGHLLHCNVCKDGTIQLEHLSYSCVKCEYYAHVRCIVTKEIFDSREKVEHFSHLHVLFDVGNKRFDGMACYACEKLIQVQEQAYGCEQCKYYLHKCCIDLPRLLQHLFHRHPLHLKSHKVCHQCCCCNKYLQGFFFRCDSCCFYLDLDCASLQSQFEFEGRDEHLLFLFEKLQHRPNCKQYVSIIYGPDDKQCVKCYLRVYLLRSPLPQTIKCTSHQPHLLTLMDKIFDDNYDKHVCDVCEEERDPELAVYSCAECDFIAEFDCVISEVILALQKKPRDVPLRRIGRNTTLKLINRSLTLKAILHSFTVEEVDKCEELEQAFKNIKEEIRKTFSRAGHEAKVTSPSERITHSGEFVYSDEDYYYLRHLVAGPDRKLVPLLNEEDSNCEVVNVGGYKTVPVLASILTTLVDKYGDIGATCNLPPTHSNLKTIIMALSCAIVHSMCSTMIQDVDYDLVHTWWMYFYFARRTGFQVDFLFGHLKRIVQAHHRFVSGDQIMMSPIQEHYEEITKRSRKIDELVQDIDQRKENLDALKKQTQELIANIPYQKWRSETEQLSRLKDLGMMKAGIYTGVL